MCHYFLKEVDKILFFFKCYNCCCSVLTMNKILDFLIDVGTITRKKKEDILYQLTLPPPSSIEDVHYNAEWSLTARKDSTTNPFNKKMLEVMNKVRL